jgi:hypothetical protein
MPQQIPFTTAVPQHHSRWQSHRVAYRQALVAVVLGIQSMWLVALVVSTFRLDKCA